MAIAESPVARIARLLGVVPDLLTALACVVVWVAPFAFGADAVKTIVLLMLMEFLLVHGTGFFSGLAFADAMRKGTRLLAMAGLLCFYGIFVAAFALSFREWWPVWMFAWLVLSKAAWVLLDRRQRDEEKTRQIMAWGFSVAAYILAVFAGLMLPLPRLGLDAATVAQLGLPGSGEWVERPHTVVSAMALYYFANAWFKWRMGRMKDADIPRLANK